MTNTQSPSLNQPPQLSKMMGFSLGVALLSLAIAGCSTRSNESNAITSPANPAKVALAQHLTASGAKMYGTYWCPYCTQQKELFGQAIEKAPVIECDPKGPNAQPALCANANVRGYPTWEIQGQQYSGVRSLEELAQLSNYKGATNFSD